jgi:hypothetical protein
MVCFGGLFLLLRRKWNKLHELANEHSTTLTMTSSSSSSSPTTSAASTKTVSDVSNTIPLLSSLSSPLIEATSKVSQPTSQIAGSPSIGPTLASVNDVAPLSPTSLSSPASPTNSGSSSSSSSNSNGAVSPRQGNGMNGNNGGNGAISFALMGAQSPVEAKAAYAERERVLAASHVQLLTSGTLRLRKWGRDRKCKTVILQCSSDLISLQWGTNRLSVDSLRDVIIGRSSPVFTAVDARRSVLEREPDEVQRSFSLVFKSRTLDLGNLKK